MGYIKAIKGLRSASVCKNYGSDLNGEDLYYVDCAAQPCTACLWDDALHRVCPVCGARLVINDRDERLMTYTCRPYRCLCSTLIWVCRGVGCHFVRAYATNDMFKIEEDTI